MAEALPASAAFRRNRPRLPSSLLIENPSGKEQEHSLLIKCVRLGISGEGL
jgi:hypothetical protein